jgi:adenylyltransferase/sulfurtransferase
VTDRYARQKRFAPVGEAGQRAIGAASALVVGCGALGTAAAELLVRCGVGRLTIADRDYVEPRNLSTQLLFTEEDARRALPKAVAAAEALRAVNSSLCIDAEVVDVNPRTVRGLLKGVSIALDATDNMETRFLLNDAALSAGVLWVHAAAVGSRGVVMPVVPGLTACLRCLYPEPPPPGSLPTCETAGLLASLPAGVASLQVSAALRLLVEGPVVPCRMIHLDAWRGAVEELEVPRREGCPACGQGLYEFLEGRATSRSATICGRDAVQVLPAEDGKVSLQGLRESLAGLGPVDYNGYILRFRAEGHELVIFPTGRAIVKGTADPATARSLYARYVGA